MAGHLSIYPHGYPSEAWLSPAPLDDIVMTKRNDCSNCGQRDGCNGTCLIATAADQEEMRRDG